MVQILQEHLYKHFTGKRRSTVGRCSCGNRRKFVSMKIKYHQGSRGVTPGLWVFGLVDREIKEVRWEVVEKRDKDLLLLIIRKHIGQVRLFKIGRCTEV